MLEGTAGARGPGATPARGSDPGEFCNWSAATQGFPTPPAPSINSLILEKQFTSPELLFPHWDKIKLDNAGRKHAGNAMLMFFMVCWFVGLHSCRWKSREFRFGKSKL